MNELKNVALQVAQGKYTLGEDKLLFAIHKQEIVENEISNLINMGWVLTRTTQQQPIDIQNYINENR